MLSLTCRLDKKTYTVSHFYLSTFALNTISYCINTYVYSNAKVKELSLKYFIFAGIDMLHRLTSLKPQVLREDMEGFNGEKSYAVYSSFSVGDEASKYIFIER